MRSDAAGFDIKVLELQPGKRVPAWVEDREVIAVFADRGDPRPIYFMWLEWRDGRISFIHDYRYVRYVLADAEWGLAPDGKPAGAAD